jgi:hypothetical protein
LDDLVKDCRGECVQGYRYEKNTVTLLAFLVPGEYRLALYYRQMSKVESQWLSSKLAYLPYTFSLMLEPLYETEDRFNCKAARLPHSLNIAGLLDAETYLNYRERVMLDLQGVSQSIAFTLAKDAVFRVVTTEPEGVDIDLKLTTSDDTQLVQSNVVGGSEGILIELKAGDYKLKISYNNTVIKSPQKLFCASYLLEIGIRTQTLTRQITDFYSLDSCQDETAAIDAAFSPLQDSLKGAKDASFIMNPNKSSSFRLPTDPLKGEQVIYSYEFELTQSAYVNFGEL